MNMPRLTIVQREPVFACIVMAEAAGLATAQNARK